MCLVCLHMCTLELAREWRIKWTFRVQGWKLENDMDMCIIYGFIGIRLRVLCIADIMIQEGF